MAISKFGMIARLVWDGGKDLVIAPELGAPADGQMQGTVGERLTELSGRTCYDSLGRGRSSPDYHKHISDVGHFSVDEHFHCTVATGSMVDPWVFVNRPGIWVRRSKGLVRVTFNPRVILDWNRWSRDCELDDLVGKPGSVGDLLAYHAETLYPMIVVPRERPAGTAAAYKEWSNVAEPEHDEEKWVSFFLAGSRGWSHEQVRHRFRTAVSQRSTRFVDESESVWLEHPLVLQYLDDPSVNVTEKFGVRISKLRSDAREAYKIVADTLQEWLLKRGVDKFTARKQARGAARGYLGNALATEMIFTASVGQWKRMLRLRCVGPADAEIRVLMAEVLAELRASRYGDDFKAFELVGAEDGIGQVAVEKRG